MRVLRRLALLALLSACSIDFVAVPDPPLATWIDVTSDHTDSLRATVEVRHEGAAGINASVNGLAGRGQPPAGETRSAVLFDLVLDPLLPVLEIDIETSPSGLVALRLPLLAKNGDATCEANGDLRLPFALDPASLPGGDRWWDLLMVSANGDHVTDIRSVGVPLNPFLVPAELLTDPVARASLLVVTSGSIQEIPHPIGVTVRTTASWAVPPPC